MLEEEWTSVGANGKSGKPKAKEVQLVELHHLVHTFCAQGASPEEFKNLSLDFEPNPLHLTTHKQILAFLDAVSFFLSEGDVVAAATHLTPTSNTIYLAANYNEKLHLEQSAQKFLTWAKKVIAVVQLPKDQRKGKLSVLIDELMAGSTNTIFAKMKNQNRGHNEIVGTPSVHDGLLGKQVGDVAELQAAWEDLVEGYTHASSIHGGRDDYDNDMLLTACVAAFELHSDKKTYDLIADALPEAAKQIRKLARWYSYAESVVECLQRRTIQAVVQNLKVNVVEPSTQRLSIGKWQVIAKEHGANDDQIASLARPPPPDYPRIPPSGSLSIKVPLHAELVVVQAVLKDHPNTKRVVVGVSKDSCFSCYHALGELGKKGVKVNVRGTHGKVYPRRRKPNWIDEDDEQLEARLKGFWQKKLKATKPRGSFPHAQDSDFSHLAQTHSDNSDLEERAEELREAMREIKAARRSKA